jgi:hypothetical protein
MAERPPTTDLRGGKTSDDSFTMLMANLVAEYAVGFQINLFSCGAVGSTVESEDPKCPSLGMERVGSSSPTLHESGVRRITREEVVHVP